MFTQNQLEILAIFMSHQEKDYNLSEIGRILKKKPGVIQKTMNALEKWGILSSLKRGNQRLYKINNNFRLFLELKSIVEKTTGAEGLLRTAVKDIKGINTALIYGSYVKDALRPESDIDLLVAGNPKSLDDLLEKIEKLEKKINREINYKIYSMNEFDDKRKSHDPFLDEVLNDKYILLKGKL